MTPAEQRERRQLRAVRSVTFAAGVAYAVVAVIFPPFLWALTALLVFCAVMAGLWAGANRSRAGLHRRRALVVPEPRSNVLMVRDDVPDFTCGEPTCTCADLPNS